MDISRQLSWAMGKKTVLCVGNANIDCISITNRFPKTDEVETSSVGYWQRGGNAANNCTVLRSLGVDVEFFGVVCSNDTYKMLANDMKMRGIRMENCPTQTTEPPFSTVVVNRRSRQSKTITCHHAMAYPTLEDFQKLDLSKYGWIHFRGRRPSVTIEMMRTVDAFNEKHPKEPIIISMDMDHDLKETFPLVNYCDYLFCYRALAKTMPWQSPREACLDLDEMLRMRFGINLKRPFVVFLWNLQKVGLMDANSDYTHTASYKPKKFVDSVGATEAFVAGFIYAVYVRDRNHRLAADFASLLANYKCTDRGFDHIPNALAAPVL